ncbi:MAG TPA: 7-carboxy-7-deazaguanine synthase QueE [Solirubrobacteraceae bacterium]|jgi:7-carboxy-7-deazaguanine synthase|nr:7-carboxy-7-deazaguanine synthase QueE [Solirubrobacteraceae bacterium]
MLATPATDTRQHTAGAVRLPVIEIFGPTIQGEGPDAGVPAYFVRFGGCDYRCTWCDSMHAVDPAKVRANAARLTADQIVQQLGELGDGPGLVVLSGGNPALLDLGALALALKQDGRRVAVETQGSRWRDWLADVDRLVISPKPPSSGMAGAEELGTLEAFMSKVTFASAPALKIVVFDQTDLEWAVARHRDYPRFPLFLSVGTDVGLGEEETLGRLRERYRWLCETVARWPDLRDAHVQPQLHVIAWGTATGV